MLKSGTVIKNYEIITELKQGSQGFVYLVEDQISHVKNVLKSVFVEESKKMEFERMIVAWRLFSESNEKDCFVEYKDYFYEGKNGMIVMEYCDGGDLEMLIRKRLLENRKFTETEVVKVMIDVMSALKEMQSRGFIHRDIKSANIFLTKDGKFKIGDFCSSKILNETVGTTTVVGSLEFTAPEIVNSEKYSYSVDVFSTGAVLYQLMVGKTPFVNECGIVLRNLSLGKYEPIPTNIGYSKSLLDLVHGCLILEPSARPSPLDVLDAPFVLRAQFRMAMERAQGVAVQREGQMREEAEMREQKLREEIGVLSERVAVLEAESVARKEAADLPIRFLPQPLSLLKNVESDGDREFRFPKLADATVLIDCELSGERIYVLDMILTGGVSVGLALRSLFPAQCFKGAVGQKDTCFMCCGGGGNMTVGTKTYRLDRTWRSDGPVHITLELDVSASSASSSTPGTAAVSTPQSTSLSLCTSNLISASTILTCTSTSTFASASSYSSGFAHTLRYFADGVLVDAGVVGVPAGTCFALTHTDTYGTALVLSLRTTAHAKAFGGTDCREKHHWGE